MGVSVQEIYKTALAIMDESDSADYRARVPGLVNTLLGRCWMVSEEHEFGGHSMWTPVEAMEDEVAGIDRSLALSAMPYGLAAQLYLQEDPKSAESWWDIFQENLATFRRNRPADLEKIKDVYGGIEYSGFGRW